MRSKRCAVQNQRITYIAPAKKNRINVFSNSSGRKIYRMYESLINVDILITFSLQMNEDKLHKKE